MDFLTITEKIEQNKQLDFGDILSRSIELFKKVWLQGFLAILLTFVAIGPIIFIMYMPMIGAAMAQAGNSTINEYGYYEAQPIDTSVIVSMYASMALAFLLIFALSFLLMALVAGFFRVLKRTDLEGVTSNNDLFFYFKGKYLLKTFLLGLSSAGIAIVAFMACVLPVYYVMIPMSLFIVFFAYNPDLSISEIIKLSFKLGNKKWFFIFGMIFVAGLIAEVGIFACGIGILFTASFARIPLYFIYKDTIGFDDATTEPKAVLV